MPKIVLYLFVLGISQITSSPATGCRIERKYGRVMNTHLAKALTESFHFFSNTCFKLVWTSWWIRLKWIDSANLIQHEHKIMPILHPLNVQRVTNEPAIWGHEFVIYFGN